MIAKPFLKWAGGKTSLLPEILPRLPKKIGTYYEPFVGGGAVFFALANEKRFKHAAIGDANDDLIQTYFAVQYNLDETVHRLKIHAVKHSKDYFYKVRARAGAHTASRFIYLNRTCFNGLYRVNKKGEFNVPFGDYKNPTICDEEGLTAASAALRDVTLRSLDFETMVYCAKRGDAVYFDPPYIPLSATSNFTAYSVGGFTLETHERLRDCADRLRKKGVRVLLSNSDTPLARKLYKGFYIEKVKARRAINSKGDKRGAVGELLISGIVPT